MRKTMAVLLAVGAMMAVSGQAVMAADRAGVGLEWSVGPVISVSGFDMRMGQQFTLDWRLSETFSVGVWNSSATYRGSHSYTDNVDRTLTHELVTSGSVSANGITLLASLPAMSLIELGINVGVGTLTPDAVPLVATDSDGTAGALGDFGGPVPLQGTVPLLGIAARVHLLKAETKTILTDIGIIAAFNFVEFQDTNAFGTQEVLGVPSPTGLLKKIDPVGSYNNLALMLNAAIWF
jgi:hypothetical protein